MAIVQLHHWGDSLTAGKIGAHDYCEGGDGVWPEHVDGALARILQLGPRISAGIQLTERSVAGLAAGEWSGTGTSSGTLIVSTDPWDRYPSSSATGSHGHYGSGSAITWTYTVPAWMGPSLVGFSLYWIDLSNGSTIVGGNWSWKKNSGAFTAMGQILSGDNRLKVFYVTQALVPGDTITIRAADASGTACYCLPVGIEPYFLVPTTTTGWVSHNVAIGGAKLNELVKVTSGDRLAFADDVRSGTGNPIIPAADINTLEFLNDVLLANSTQYGTDLQTFFTRMGSKLTGIINPYEANTVTYPSADQTAYRAQAKTTAAAQTPVAPVVDFFDIFKNAGWNGNTAMFNAGFLESDQIHPSQLGHYKMWPPIYAMVAQLLALRYHQPTYPAVSQVAAPTTWKGKVAAPTVWGAALPIEIH